MSGKEGSSRGSGGSLVLAITISIAVAVAAAGGYVWYRSAGESLPTPAQLQAPQDVLPARPDEPVQVTLFVPMNGMLAPLTAGARRQLDLQLEARAAAAAVLAGEHGEQAAVLKELHLRALYLDPAGTAFVDLSPAGQKVVRGSAWDELLAVYAVVDTLTQNFPEIKQVRFLVDGRETQTLAGHVDLMRSFVKRTDLVRGQ